MLVPRPNAGEFFMSIYVNNTKHFGIFKRKYRYWTIDKIIVMSIMVTSTFRTTTNKLYMTHILRPFGYHCERFDTSLLWQIVEVEVELAASRLRRERGIVLSSATQSAWARHIFTRVSTSTFAEISSHSFLPSVMNIRLKTEIERLVCDEVLLSHEPTPSMLVRFWPIALAQRVVTILRMAMEKQVE